MKSLEEIADRARQDFENTMKARDQALAQARLLIRYSSQAIRATHRNERAPARDKLVQAARLAEELNNNLRGDHPHIYYAGYTQDALKEFAEANIVYALVDGEENIPSPELLQIPFNTYLKGLAEAATEMRRRCLDKIRTGDESDAEDLLDKMEEIFGVLVTMDYPDAITGGLRRQTDIVRGVVERTRGDLTISLRQKHLEESLGRLEAKIRNQ